MQVLSNHELYCIGYAGRNKEKTLEHIEELKKIGVPEPKSVPELYHLSPNLVSTDEKIKVIGNKTSGEIEIVLVTDNDENLFVTVGSDHTDRGLETVSIHKSKQVCAKPIAKETWAFSDVEDEWDDLVLYSEVHLNEGWKKYQEDKVSSIIPLYEIKAFLKDNNIEMKNSIVYCGTVPLLDGFAYGDRFKGGLRSEKLNKSIDIEYKIERLKE